MKSAKDLVRALAAATADVEPGECGPKQDCYDRIKLAIFFDGTGNNRDADTAAEKWSNVARLFDAHRDEPGKGIYKRYISGVGTPHNWGDGSLWATIRDQNATGGAIGWGAEARLEHGDFIMNDRLKAALEIAASKARAQTKTIVQKNEAKGLAELADAVSKHRLIKSIEVSIIGFSRGAALARVFANRLKQQCKQENGQLTYQGVPLTLKFVGLFDTVASMGRPAKNDYVHVAAQYRYEVWGGGYNWLQLNVDSANDIKDYIENKVLASYPEDQRGRMKVILVTHSMGGFVARALTEIVGYEKVLGVVHGVMPATGAPAIYHHMRCGYEGVASVILGRDAAEVVAVAAYSPGALQLTPAFDYAGGKPWLKLGDGGASEPGRSLPTSGNPYDEIYKSRAWYGLIPEHNAKLINPAQLTGPAQESKDIYGGMSSLEAFDLTIDSVRSFHAELAKKYPKPAYCHYGADSGQKTWSEVRWQGTLTALPEQWQVEDDDGNGRLRLTNAGQHVELEFGPPEGMGDGTVSTESGSAPGEAGVQASFRQGNQADGAYARMNGKGKEQGYEHQDSYNDPRAQWATLYGIVRIARQADWSSC